MIGRYKEGESTPLKDAIHEDWRFYYNRRINRISLVALKEDGSEPTKAAIKKKVLELGRRWHDSKTWRQAFETAIQRHF